MRKFLLVLISALLVFSVSHARAEQSATMYDSSSTGDYTQQQVFIYAYNNSGADVSSNSVVSIDVSATAASTLGTYFTTSGTSGNSYILGVTDEDISSATYGRICVRGPHILRFDSAPTAADSVTNDTIVGWGTTGTSTSNKYGYVGTALKATGTGEENYGLTSWWIWVNPGNQ